ncbi:hypothetical protein [Paenibacillus odorifer]|uniref:hypothetical protein n=1 Tax=Paenibacillus odorifer TaxID=189426 RepID=UPI00096D35B5|nr:hypothetical protein [Paenibacillus odorifer]OME27744.1 hypothetical protein BSK57_03775 [Paenibacillus odorifer]
MEILCSPYTEDIELNLENRNIVDKRALHLTPTLILYRRRLKFYAKKLYRQLQVNNNSAGKIDIEQEIHKYIDLYEVNQYVKTLRQNTSTKVLTKSEGSVILERILKENSQTTNPSWASVLQDLNSLFYDLSLTGISPEEFRTLDNSKKWSQIMDIYKIYTEKLFSMDVMDKGLASYHAVETLDISQYQELILDGAFLPPTPIFQMIINKFIASNKPITIYLPFDLDVPDHLALKATRTVYEDFKPISEWKSIRSNKSQTHFINQLPKNILRDSKPIFLDASFELLRFNTVEEELTYIMQKIYVLIKFKEVSPKNIVIITPGAMQLRPLMREISEQYNLKVHLPRRPLIHLAQGRAIKYLFDVFTDIRKEEDTYFSTKMMKVMINNSLLKHNPSLLQTFEKIEGFFEDLISVGSFISKIDCLMIAKTQLDPAYELHPLIHVDTSQLVEIKTLLENILEISSSIIKVSPKTISAHVQALIHTLQTDSRIIDISPSLWDRILKITDTIGYQHNIVITGMEFGSRISALFTEQEEFEEGQEPAEDEEDIYLEKEILVTGPNNVEFQRYDYVFLCRFTQDKYPESKMYPWFMPKEIEQQILLRKTNLKVNDLKILETFYLDRSLYHLYLTMRAPATQLTVSYSLMDNGQPLTPSHYLHDIAKVFGIEEGDRLENKNEPSLESLLEKHGVVKSPASLKTSALSDPSPEEGLKVILQEREFTAEDVAIFQYCQRRFYYQHKYQVENIYTQLFHLQAYATSCLYEKSIEHLIQNELFPITESIDLKKQQNRLLHNIKNYRLSAEATIRKIFPFGNRQWHNVTTQTDFFLKELLKRIFENPYVSELRKKGDSTVTIHLSLSNSPDTIQIGDFTFTSIRELEVQYNNRILHRYSISNRKDILSFSSRNQDEVDFMDELKDWYFNFKREFRIESDAVISTLGNVVESINKGNFRKNTGGHCMYCTFNQLCREREVVL